MTLEMLEQGIDYYGSPLYVFDMDEMKAQIDRFSEIIAGRADLCYAMKANPFLIQHMESMVNRIEVCSMGEFRICKEMKIKPEKILISGVLKKKEDILEILECYGGTCTYTIESLNQYQHFVKWSEDHHQVISVILRLTSGDQFGMDQDIIENMMELQSTCPYLQIQGIHYFTGTQKRKVTKAQKELEYLDQVIQEIQEKTGCSVDELEYGPGILVPYFTDQEDTMDQDMNAICQTISNMDFKGKVTLEMGRAMAAGCGYYLTTIRDVKQNQGKNYCLVDGGLHHMNYDGQIKGIYQPEFQVIAKHRPDEESVWTVCGSLCTFNDVLLNQVQMKDVRIGNILVFQQAGAYSMTEGMSLFLSHGLPKISCYSQENGFELLRDRQETYTMNMKQR